jgi:hypothetical protein
MYKMYFRKREKTCDDAIILVDQRKGLVLEIFRSKYPHTA